MAKQESKNPTWKVGSRRSSYTWEGSLLAYWEVDFDAMSDDFSPHEVDAHELFERWVKVVQGKYSNGLIPISWFVKCKEHGKLELMPFQFKYFTGTTEKDFLDYYTWPEDSVTGERLNWLTLPVMDKLWDSEHGDKGGFIQSATGWKPAILQPDVYLLSLKKAVHP